MLDTLDVATGRETRRALRELGGVERLFHLCAQRIPTHFCIVGEIRGRVEAAGLRSALEAVSRRHPLLRACVARSDQATLTAYESDRPIELRLLAFASEDWTALVERQLSTTFPDDRGPLMRADAMLGDDRATIVLTFHHVLSDGLSGVRAMSDLLDHLAGGRLTRTDVPDCLDSFAERAFGTLQADDAAAPAGVEPAVPTSARRRVSKVAFDSSETKRLLVASRKARTTLHGTICAGLASLAAPEAGFDIFSAMNLREAVRAPEDVCSMFITGVPSHLPAGPGIDFWTVARALSEELAAERTPEALRTKLPLLPRAVPHDAKADEAVAVMGRLLTVDALVTNLGALKIGRRFGDLELEAVWGPLASTCFDLAVYGVTGHDGALRIVEIAPQDHPPLLEPLRTALVQRIADDA